jgi:hypothetical protein
VNFGPGHTLDTSDPGDDVALRFLYQHCYAAINAIRLLTKATDVEEIICENHEDILVKHYNGDFIAIQVKSRATDQDHFKANENTIVSALCRFCALDKKFPNTFASFEIVTNHSFWINIEDQRNLPWLLREAQTRQSLKGLKTEHPLRQLTEKLCSTSNRNTSEVFSTLKKILLNGHGTDIASIRHNVRDALAECPGIGNLPFSCVCRIAESLIGLARDASTRLLSGPITDLYAAGTHFSEVSVDQRLEGKRIRKVQVTNIIDDLKNRHLTFENLDISHLLVADDFPSTLRTMVEKMARGGVEALRVLDMEDLVHSLEALLLRWTNQYGHEEATSRYRNVLRIVQSEAVEAQVIAEKTGAPYGSKMYSDLRRRLNDRCNEDPDQIYRCRPEHLMGAAGVLTEKCKTWWSPQFTPVGDKR